MKESEEQEEENSSDKQDHTQDHHDSRTSPENRTRSIRKWMLVALILSVPILLLVFYMLLPGILLFAVPISLVLLLAGMLFLFLYVTAPSLDK